MEANPWHGVGSNANNSGSYLGQAPHAGDVVSFTGPNEPTIVHRRSVATKRHFGVIAVAGSTTR